MGKKTKELRKVVLDTNVLVSALLFKGKASRLVGLWKQQKIIPLVTNETLDELIRVLSYPKFSLTEEEIKSLISEEILPYFRPVKISRYVHGICPDPEDDIFLTCAINGRADAIISGDAHLLNLKEFDGIPIMKINDLKITG